MARKAVELNEGIFSCSICLEILKDPVTIPCGHSYCINCLGACWDGEEKAPSCPQCRQTFTPRPALVKNTMLAVLVEELKKTPLQTAASPDDEDYAQPGDVACDVCIGRKLRAVKSCLQCLATYCDKHLQPHYDAAPLKKHKLVEPSNTLQDNICSDHNEVKKLFCRLEKQCICHICCWDQHKGHHAVYVAAERTERQKEIKPSRQKIQKIIEDQSEDVIVLKGELEAIKKSADKAVEDSDQIFTELISLMEEQKHKLRQKIRSQEQQEVSRVTMLQHKLQQDISELQRQDEQLEKLPHIEDHNQFLDIYQSLPKISEYKESFSVSGSDLTYFQDVKAALSSLKDQVQTAVLEERKNLSVVITQPDVLLKQPQPKTRDEFLKYSCELTLDPNTAPAQLIFSEGNKRATIASSQSSYQVLSRESLTQRSYWEVQGDCGKVSVAVSYKNKQSLSSASRFGYNNQSWALLWINGSFKVLHNSVETVISVPNSSRIGVYLDHKAGILAFYRVSETMTLLHRVQTTFTQPLYAGLWLQPGCYSNATALFCKPAAGVLKKC